MGRTTDRFVAWAERAKTFLDFGDDNLGNDLAKLATDGVMENIKGQHAPDGSPWPRLSAGYEEAKARSHPGQPMGILDFLMALPAEVAGTVVVLRDSTTVSYGVTSDAQQEASWFSEGGGNRPPRPFWGLTEDSRRAIKDYLDKRFKEKVH